MFNHFSHYFLLILLLTQAATLQARIYKWTDENGKVVYGEQPPPEIPRSDIERLKVQTKPSADDDTEASQQTDTSAESTQKLAKDSAYCQQQRKRLQILESDAIVTVNDKEGAQRKLNTQERQQEINTSRENLAKYCS